MFRTNNVMGQEVETVERGLKSQGRVTATSCNGRGQILVYVMDARGHVECHHIVDVRFLRRWDPEKGQLVRTTD